MSGPLPHPRPAALDAEAGVRALLAQQKWRQARDELKALVKADRARFLPLLIDANIGLARKMLAAGELGDARQVLDHLKKLAPPEQLRELELQFAIGNGGAKDGLTTLIVALADGTPSLADAERVKVADTAVLLFQPGAAHDSTPPAQARLLAEMRAVQAALEALSRSAWAEVTEALRQVSFRSPFAHWTAFIKGVAAYHVGEDERAVKLWRSLPPESVPAKTSLSYLLLMESATNSPGEEASPSALHGACRLVVGSAAELLVSADRQWRDGKMSDSYQVVRNKLEGFPSVALDWRGALTEFYFKAPHGMGSIEWRKYLEHFLRLDVAKAFKDDVETLHAFRMMSIIGRNIAPVSELRRYWKEFLRLHQLFHGTNPQLASLGYAWLGEQLSMPTDEHRDEWEADDIEHPAYAIEDLETSIKLDRTNLHAHLKLCKLYEVLKKGSERNRLLDQMTKRFPDDKEVLVAAGRGCIERNVYTKALDYLGRARQLDRLDPQIPCLIVAALEGQARTFFHQRRPDEARQALARTGEWLTGRPDDLQISRWSAAARHAALERIWGAPAEAEKLLGESSQLSPLVVAPLFIAHLTHREYLKPHEVSSPYLASFEKALRLHPNPREISLLMRILESWMTANEKFRANREGPMIIGALIGAAGKPFTRTEVLDLLESGGGRGRAGYQKALEPFVRKLLREDPKDPALRLWRAKFGEGETWRVDALRSEVEAIVAEASLRHDETTLRGARALLQDLTEPPPPPDFDDDDEDDFDDEDDDADDGLGEAFPPGMMKFMDEFIALIKTATPAEIRLLRKNPPPGIPKFIIDEVIDLVERGFVPPSVGTVPKSPKGIKPVAPVPPLSPPPGPKSPRPTSPPSDPNQLKFL